MIVQVFANAVLCAAVYALVGLGFGLAYSVTRFFHFAHGAVVVCGAYAFYLFTAVLGCSPWVAAMFAILAAVLLGCAVEWMIYRPLRRQRTTPLGLLLASLGIYIVWQNAIALCFGDETRSVRSSTVSEGIDILGARLTSIQLWTILLAATLVAATAVWLSRSPTGKAMRAVGNDIELALSRGLPVERIVLLTFGVASALAGVAGILVAMDVDMCPTMGLHILMMSVVVVIVGGVGSTSGVAVAALLLGCVREFSGWFVGSQWRDGVSFLVLLVFLVLRPQGVFGKPLRKAEL